MKESWLCGLILGMVAGAVLTKNSPEVKSLVEKGENSVKENMQKIKEKL